MSNAARLAVIRGALNRHPAVSRVALAADGARLMIEAQGKARMWSLALTMTVAGGLPEIKLQDEELRGSLAHVSHGGDVCFTDRDGLSIDEEAPGEVAFTALTEALDVLDRSFADFAAGNNRELLDEFEGYWVSLPKIRGVDVHVEIDEFSREIVAVVDKNRDACALIERRSLERESYGGLRRLSSLRQERAIYLPLSVPVLPPSIRQPLGSGWIRNELDKAIGSLPATESGQGLLKSWRRRVDSAYILLSQPRANGRAAFAIQFVGRPAPHPLRELTEKWNITPLAVNRHTPAYLHARGGGSTNLARAHVAIVGCGAVGCRVAEHLALAGVGCVTLVDHDHFASDNVFRHLLGGEYAGHPKALALKNHLSRRLPGIRVNAEPVRLAEWAARADLAALTGIVLAIGIPHEERAFNRKIRGQSAFTGPLVTTWLEPLGLGGHSVCSVPTRPGCLECLYTRADGTLELWPKTSFLAPGQRIARNLTGCVGSFTPFSATDATTTALLATRQLTAALLGKAFMGYACWSGSDEACRSAGLNTTSWYSGLTQAQIELAGQDYCRAPCPVCGGSR